MAGTAASPVLRNAAGVSDAALVAAAATDVFCRFADFLLMFSLGIMYG